MSVSLEEGPLKEAAIFTRAVENVFRKLIRLLLGRMTLVKLQEMIRLIFVEEAELHLKRERPGKNVPLTNMALLSGLDTRTLSRVFRELDSRTPVFQKTSFLKELIPESCVLDYWNSSARYRGKDHSRPLVLPIRGDYPSFETLVSESCSLRGVTANSMLRELVKSNSISVDHKHETVSFMQHRYMPTSEEGYSAQIDIGFAAVGHLLDTLLSNILGKKAPEDRYFQRTNWTNRLRIVDRPAFRLSLKKFLEKAEKDAVKLMSKFESDQTNEEHVVGGVSMYYFEDDS